MIECVFFGDSVCVCVWGGWGGGGGVRKDRACLILLFPATRRSFLTLYLVR